MLLGDLLPQRIKAVSGKQRLEQSSKPRGVWRILSSIYVNGKKPLTILAKHFIVDVCQDPNYASEACSKLIVKTLK